MSDDFAAGMRRAAEIARNPDEWAASSRVPHEAIADAILAAIPAPAPWTPPEEAERPEGFRCLGWLSGVWQTVRWQRRWGWLDKDGLCRDPKQFHPAPPAPEAPNDATA